MLNRFSFLVFLIFVLITSVFGWDSIGQTNHRQLTVDAIAELGVNNYPDFDKYRGFYFWPLKGDGVVEGSITGTVLVCK